jgi:hypothetical protein
MTFTEQVAWDKADFALMGAMLFGACGVYELAARKTASFAYRAAVGVAVGAALILIWLTLAVGIIGSEDDPANLMYGGVLVNPRRPRGAAPARGNGARHGRDGARSGNRGRDCSDRRMGLDRSELAGRDRGPLGLLCRAVALVRLALPESGARANLPGRRPIGRAARSYCRQGRATRKGQPLTLGSTNRQPNW